MFVRLLLGLGGNQGDVQVTLARAVGRLREHTDVIACSGLWRTAPEGPPQPDFLNAAVLVELRGHPAALLALCRRIEGDAGRDREHEGHWGPRTLDLDLLMAPGIVLSTAVLELPHPSLARRRFALAPAAELAADWVHPRALRTLAELAAAPAVTKQRCDRLGPFPTP